MIVPPGFSRPSRSASSIILRAMRSLIELPGLNVSILASTVASITPLVMRLIRTIGVWPMASRMVSPIFVCCHWTSFSGRWRRAVRRQRRGM